MTTAEYNGLIAALPEGHPARKGATRPIAKGYVNAVAKALGTKPIPPDPKALWDAYQRLGTLKAVGKEFNLCAESVRQHLKRAGCRVDRSDWTAEEVDQIKAYAAASDRPHMSVFAKGLGRTVASIDLKLSRLGLSRNGRTRKPAAVQQPDLPWSRWTKHEHPRGMKGKRHTEALKAAQSARSKAMWNDAKATGTRWMREENRQQRSDRMSAMNVANIAAGTNTYSRCKRGRREDLGDIHFRSAWEANIARYLNLLMRIGDVERWEYETETFWFEAIRRGVRSYTPDFKVWDRGNPTPYFIEVKGWMDPKSATKLKRMRKYYPHVHIDLIDEKRYRGIANSSGPLIPLWEGGRK